MSGRNGWARAARAGSLLFVLYVIGHESLDAQSAAPADPVRVPAAAPLPEDDGHVHASPLLAEDHWAVRAAARAEAMGLAPSFFPAQRSAPRHAVAGALAQAAQRAAGTPWQALAQGWWRRFTEEFPEHAPGAPSAGFRPLGGYAAAGGGEERGRLAPARSAQPAQPVADASGFRASALLAGAAGPHLAGAAEPAARDGEIAVRRWDLVAGAGRWSLGVGRDRVGYGWGRGGSFVFSGPEPVPRAEVQTARPVRLPLAGAAAFHLFFSPVDEARHPGEPWMWGARVAARPHERLTLGLTRGSLFGGDVAEVTPGKVLGSLVGVVRQRFDNQVLAFDLRWRLPVEAVLPATVYLEWAADDGAGALNEQPAILGGVYLPALPGAPALAAGVEHAYMAACCGHGSWYFHHEFTGNWARGGRTLGHPLGGGGRETRVYADAHPGAARLRLGADAWLRRRASHSSDDNIPGNLLAPERTGRSTGGSLEGAWRPAGRAELGVRLAGERGDGWSERRIEAELRYLF